MNNITVDDIQIFIATHNRVNYLKESIESILNQSVEVKEIVVLDNESTDDTETVVKKYFSKGIKYVKTFGFLGNYKKAKELANKKYCMLFHDDDLLHPKYLERVVFLLNKHKNVSLITTRYKEFLENDIPSYSDELSQEYYLFKNQKDFATHMYFIELIAYAPAIYRTADYKNTDIEYEKYNKFHDWPLMVKMSGYGKSILLNEKEYFLCRRHSGQDTWTYTNVPTFEQIVNWDKIFFDAMKLSNNTFSVLQKMFNRKCYYFITSKYDAFTPPSYKSKTENAYTDIVKIANKNNIYPTIGQEVDFWYNKFSKHILKKINRNGLVK